MTQWVLTVPLVSLLVAAACGTGIREAPDDKGAPADRAHSQRLTGRLLLTGTHPMVLVTLQTDDSTAVNLTGNLELELRRLSGATVEVQGTPAGGGAPLGTFAVDEYRVVAIEGQTPIVGIVQLRGDTIVLSNEAGEIRLANTPKDLTRLVGAKIWVIGRQSPGTLQVQSFGIIRDP